MIERYMQSVLMALGGVLGLVRQLALPLAICAGLLTVAAAVWQTWGKGAGTPSEMRRTLSRTAGWLGVLLLTVASWAALKTALPIARQERDWQASAEATTNTTADAPPVQQYGPAVAALVERTYTRTLNLPPDFLQRIGTDGVGVLSPYLSDPSAENVTRLRDTFRRSGTDVVFTRDLTRRDEEPVPFDSARIQVGFRRAAGRGYDATFEGHYVWSNPQSEPMQARFQFTPPSAGAVRELTVSVGGQSASESSRSGGYEWQGTLAPGEKREAVVRYRVSGTRTWRYDLGSQRRKVRQFYLEATTDGPVRFSRGSLEPTEQNGNKVRWQLNDLLTAQEVALSFPPDTAQQEGYFQALSALPTSLLLFLVGSIALAAWRRARVEPTRLMASMAGYVLGLGAVTVLANYVGPVAALLVGSLAGALIASRILGRWALPITLPAALLPAVFLSPRHSGLLALALIALTIVAVWRLTPARPRIDL